MSTHSDNARPTILAAAAKVILYEGNRKLSFDRLSQQTGISKGGLLYHFKSKEELLIGVIEYAEQILLDNYTAALAGKKPYPGRTLQAYIDTLEKTYKPSKDNLHIVLLNVIAEQPQLLKAYRQLYRRLRNDIGQDGGNFIEQWSIVLTIDGLCLGEQYGQFGLQPGEYKSLLDHIKMRITHIQQDA